MGAGLLASGFAIVGLASAPDPEPRRPAAYELEWSAPAGCPDQEEVEARIAALSEGATGGEGVMAVRGDVEERGHGFAGTIVTVYDGRVDERRVDSENCDDVVDAAALVVAVALAPELDASDPIRVPEPEPEPPAEPLAPSIGVVQPRQPEVQASAGEGVALVVETDPPASRRPRRNRRPTGIGIRLGPRIEFGGLPRVSGGLDLAVGLLWPRWRAELFGAYLFAGRSGRQGAEAVYQLGVAGLRGCHRLFAGPIELPLCAGLEVGGMRVDSRSLEQQNTLLYPWLAPSAATGLGFSGSRFGLVALVEGAIPVFWSRVLVGTDNVFQNRPYSLRGMISLEVKFSFSS